MRLASSQLVMKLLCFFNGSLLTYLHCTYAYTQSVQLCRCLLRDQGIQYTCVAGHLVAGNRESAHRTLAKYACNSYREVCLTKTQTLWCAHLIGWLSQCKVIGPPKFVLEPMQGSLMGVAPSISVLQPVFTVIAYMTSIYSQSICTYTQTSVRLISAMIHLLIEPWDMSALRLLHKSVEYQTVLTLWLLVWYALLTVHLVFATWQFMVIATWQCQRRVKKTLQQSLLDSDAGMWRWAWPIWWWGGPKLLRPFGGQQPACNYLPAAYCAHLDKHAEYAHIRTACHSACSGFRRW